MRQSTGAVAQPRERGATLALTLRVAPQTVTLRVATAATAAHAAYA